MHAKPVVLLLHGFCENKSLWNEIIPHIHPDFQVLTMDLPGFGGNKVEVENIHEMSQDVHAFLVQKQVDKCVMIGHSMGGYVALDFAKNWPQMLDGLGFFHSNILADSEEKRINRTKSIQHINEFGMDEFLKIMATSLLSPDNFKNPSLMQKAKELVMHNNSKGVINALKGMRDRADGIECIRNLNIKILWIAGRNDSFSDIDSQLMQASNARVAQVHILESAGHLGMIESPAESIEEINSFLHWVHTK